MNGPGLIEELLTSARTIAIVGYSADPSRPSHSVARFLRSRGYHIVPVNPRLQGAIVEGERAYDRLVDLPDPSRIDFVDVFRRGDALAAVVDDAHAAGMKAIWFQLDLGNVDAAERAERLGMCVVWDRCTRIERQRLDRR